MKALPPKEAAPADLLQVKKLFLDLAVLQGGSSFEAPVPLSQDMFSTKGVPKLLKVSEGLFAMSIMRFWRLVKWHPAQSSGSPVTSWLELTLAFESLTVRPTLFELKQELIWDTAAWIHQPPAHKRVAVFRAALNHLAQLLQCELEPQYAEVPMSHIGAAVIRPPLPGLQGRAEYPERPRILSFVQQVLLSSRSKTAIMSQVLQPPAASATWTLEADTSAFQKPQWGWLQAADGKREWKRLPQGLQAITAFQRGSEPGRFVSVAARRASSTQRALFEELWQHGVVQRGLKLVPVPEDLLEAHHSRLSKIFPESNRNAEANGCHHMAVVSSSIDTDSKRYHCLFCSLSRDERFFRRAWREKCPALAAVEP